MKNQTQKSPTKMWLLTIASAALLTAACSANPTDQATNNTQTNNTQQQENQQENNEENPGTEETTNPQKPENPAPEQTTNPQTPDNAATELGQEPDSNTTPTNNTQTDDELLFADENGLSEEEAEEIIISDDEPVEIDLEQTPEVPQADLAVTEAALCATIQIAQDAITDNNNELANTQQNLLIERSNGITDKDLSNTLSTIKTDTPLNKTTLEKAMNRCTDLGFER